ncbi:MAG: hypothetical protein ACKO9H_08340 [Planctomycetota bacterium]
MNRALAFRAWFLAALTGLFFLTHVSSQCEAQRFPFGSKATKSNTPVNENFELTENAGPWLIMCASFAGEDGDTQARVLAEELSRKHRLKCYVHRRTFDFTQTYTGLDYDKEQTVDANGQITVQRRKMKAAHGTKFDEIAVLVGDFPSIEDGRAQQALEQIKHLQPEALGELQSGETSSQRMRVWREATKMMNGNGELKNKGPMRMAFMIPNPLLPEEFFAAQKVDTFMLGVNRQAEHSLLDCPGTYSVRVASFRGYVTFDLNQIKAWESKQKNPLKSGNALDSQIMEAGERAHLMTEELRKLGVEAYEFHDRHESYVCVGSYDWATTKDADGQITQNPEIVKTIQMFKGDVENLPNQQNALVPKSLPKLKKMGIAFDIQPVPVLVPKAPQETQTLWRK